MGLYLLNPMTSQAAGIPASMVAKANTNETAADSKIPEGLSPDKVDAYLAGLSDAQTRQVLARQLKQETAGKSQSDASGKFAAEDDPADQLFHKLTLGASIVLDQVASFFSSDSDKEGSLNWQVIFNRLSGGRGVGHIGLTLLIGLAIGFGAQTLVKDIISKLDFRVRYDTDINKVRKIIKKINKKIMKDENMAPVMLGKLKSQGVREMDDSAMIMRVKFKTIPGEQFVVRREVFRMMQESFRENGIEFAHRNVTVYLPPEVKGTESGEELKGGAAAGRPDNKLAEAAAAAGAAAIQAEEDAKKKTGPQKK